MEREQLMKTGMDLVYLTRCALRGEPPEAERVEAMDLEAVYKLAKEHSMTAVSCYALEYLWGNNCTKLNPQPAVVQEWLNDKRVAIRKNIALDMEREKLLAYLEEIGCWYMPLKGSLLQELYPRAGMRQMGDNDILVDPDFRYQIRDYMVANDCTPGNVGIAHHDEYFKKPYYNFEIHVGLLTEKRNDKRSQYYRDIRKQLQKDAGNQYGYHFRDEDFYVYMTTHAVKHYEAGGNGLRSLMDVYIYLDKKEDVLDWHYADAELTKLDLKDYENTAKQLAKKLFVTGEALSDLETKLFLYYTRCGVYGRMDVMIENRMKGSAAVDEEITLWKRIKYSFNRLFPPAEFYEYYCPLAYKYKILIPFAAIWRLIVSVTVNFSYFWREAKLTWKKTKE